MKTPKSAHTNLNSLHANDEERRASRHLVWLTGFLVMVALIWAGNFSLDEITRGNGKVIPSRACPSHGGARSQGRTNPAFGARPSAWHH